MQCSPNGSRLYLGRTFMQKKLNKLCIILYCTLCLTSCSSNNQVSQAHEDSKSGISNITESNTRNISLKPEEGNHEIDHDILAKIEQIGVPIEKALVSIQRLGFPGEVDTEELPEAIFIWESGDVYYCEDNKMYHCFIDKFMIEKLVIFLESSQLFSNDIKIHDEFIGGDLFLVLLRNSKKIARYVILCDWWKNKLFSSDLMSYSISEIRIDQIWYEFIEVFNSFELSNRAKQDINLSLNEFYSLLKYLDNLPCSPL